VKTVDATIPSNGSVWMRHTTATHAVPSTQHSFDAVLVGHHGRSQHHVITTEPTAAPTDRSSLVRPCGPAGVNISINWRMPSTRTMAAIARDTDDRAPCAARNDVSQ
jgi:hypothetical protein